MRRELQRQNAGFPPHEGPKTGSNRALRRSARPQLLRGRRTPLDRGLETELDRHFKASAFQTDDDLVFPHPQTGNPIDGSKVLKDFKDALAAAKVRKVRLHDLRHTFGTRMAAAGVPMRTLQEWMGHRDIKTTRA